MCAALFGLIAVCSTIVLSGCDRATVHRRPRSARQEERGPVEEQIQIAVRARVDARDARDRAECRRQFLRDGPRRLAQRARELERDRHREIAQRAGGRHLDGERRDVASARTAGGWPRQIAS